MHHELKIWPQFYSRVKDRSKTFEVRDNDRDFQPGDTVLLREWDPKKENSVSTGARGYTGSENISFTVGYMLYLGNSQVILSILDMKIEGVEPPPKKSKKG